MKFLIFAATLLVASPADNEKYKAKIARAVSAGPAEITNNARVVDTDEHGPIRNRAASGLPPWIQSRRCIRAR